MNRNRFMENRGVTLLELTFAMAVFAIALGVTAQSLISYYGQLDLQDRRATAIQHCRSVLGAIREIRDSTGEGYIAAITEWIEGQEVGEGGEPGGYRDVLTPMAGETITTVCTDLWTGGLPVDPMQVLVTSAFKDVRGRPMRVEATTILTRN